MAKKYTSINFNHIYDKTGTNNNNTNSNTSNLSKNQSLSSSSSFSSPSYSSVSAPNKHGKILVLTRPTPKPVNPHINSPSPLTQQQQQLNQVQQVSDRTRSEPGPNEISLRPLGRTGTPTGSLVPAHVVNNEKDKEVPLISSKPDKFVPPHLRPGYVPREEGSGQVRPRRQEHVGTLVQYGEDGRPKSGGQERMRRGSRSDSGILGRPGSSGSRPNSSG
ncbi:PREDICTED: probable basic-leucine zipper transcription factor R [Lupinus angustifolius]|nr:PREDICTED: probable basic-leucine zipper transcription factor R [Lupinus angustifolius]XP_019432136.1 PREDICTED: probable basic-leucine zipper transcription factor R [Lupinus angustifolius]